MKIFLDMIHQTDSVYVHLARREEKENVFRIEIENIVECCLTDSFIFE